MRQQDIIHNTYKALNCNIFWYCCFSFVHLFRSETATMIYGLQLRHLSQPLCVCARSQVRIWYGHDTTSSVSWNLWKSYRSNNNNNRSGMEKFIFRPTRINFPFKIYNALFHMHMEWIRRWMGWINRKIVRKMLPNLSYLLLVLISRGNSQRCKSKNTNNKKLNENNNNKIGRQGDQMIL